MPASQIPRPLASSVFPAVEDLEVGFAGDHQLREDGCARAGAADDGAGPVARANHFVEAGPVDRLHQPVLIAARHPDQRRGLERRPGARGREIHLPRFFGSGVEPHLDRAVTGILNRGRLRQDRDDRVLPARQLQRPRHDRIGRSAAADRDDGAGRLGRGRGGTEAQEDDDSEWDGHGDEFYLLRLTCAS